MNHSSVLLCLSLGVLIKCAAGSNWCYHGCEHTPSMWGELPGSVCGGQSQSPINIVTSEVQTDPNLLNFTFVNFLSQRVGNITNNGHTVMCTLEENSVEINRGGFNATYSSIQFHFHWGDTHYHPGSEHTVDGQRFPMEMHIVSLKKGLTMAQALADPQGIAVFGFFINATEDGDMSGPWSVLTSYLTNITGIQTPINNISINDLIGQVDLTKFYRYKGSLTTPNCTESVVWTVFQNPININKNLIQQFPLKTGLTNIYRPTQPLNNRQVFASPATQLPPSGHHWCYNHCAYNVSSWTLLPHSYCGGTHQSPINIDTHEIVTNKKLGSFNFKNFNDRSSIQTLTNTGHTVTCGLKDNIVEVSGGGLGYIYSTSQLHFHWGTAQSSGSEHTVDSKRYLMEMHIVSRRSDLRSDEANHHTGGLAVLGFLIEASTTSTPTSVTNAWRTLTNYLSAIQNISSQVQVTAPISIDDLIGNVNRAAYYRYNGSLTTPLCNEAVVWTVFKETVKVEQNVLMMFPNQTGYSNVFRPTQPLNGRTIYATKSSSSSPGPIMLVLLLACLQMSM